uniref:Methyltransferase FkbM domain-containing protein n=1 Tax=viral metagenome TaxID=1070528 RepID=A0A6C0D841_9ZZZZ
MALRYLTGNEKVLEIGGNIGRNSLIISSILGVNQNNLVVLESSPDISPILKHNRDINKMHFHIENSALSKRKLMQGGQIGWDTKVCENNIVEPGWKLINTISFYELILKYNIVFDTLVLDCEGAFYYILMDMPEILTNIKLIIMENDYLEVSRKHYIDDILKQNGFYVDYVEAGGWGPCQDNFFEVWKK